MPKDRGLTDKYPSNLDSGKESPPPDNFDTIIQMEIDQSLSKSEPSSDLREKILNQAFSPERTPLQSSEMSA